MRLTSESRRQRWLILVCVWVLIAMIAAFDTLALRDYVTLLDDSALINATSLPLRRSVPSDYADAQTWVRFALALDSTGDWQLRHTDIDDAPDGRAVHWSSAFAHVVALGGKLRRASTGEPLTLATERSLAWINLPLFLAVVVLVSTLIARRAGAAAAALVALGMLGHPQFYGGFAPNNVDHHGLLSAASLGVVLGVALMGVGWWRTQVDRWSLLPESRSAARTGAIVSAVSGAIGMWISAASVIPSIAIAGAAGLAVTWWGGARARDDGAVFDATLWRLWSRVGAALALVFYLVEYAPHDIALRLEVNHPLYALAWLGGGELIAMAAEWRVVARRPAIPWIALAITATLVAPLVIVIGGSHVFVPLDPGIARLHASISEFRSMASLIGSGEGGNVSRYALSVLLLLPALAALRRGRREGVVLMFTALCVVASAALAFWQVRWWLSASGPELVLLLVVVASLVGGRSERTRWIVISVIGALFIGQAVARIRLTRANVDAHAVTIADAAQPLYRDVATSLRATQPDGDLVLLASPNASSGIGYFGRFRTIGTLYWENADGLRAAAAILSARTDLEARVLMRTRGVTHIALIGHDFLAQYLELAHPGATRDDIKATFGYRLLHDDSLPLWLRPVPVPARAGDTPPALSVVALQVVAEQSEPEALWHIALARLAARDATAAEQNFRSAIALVPTLQRASLYDAAATLAYQSGAHRLASTLFREAETIAPTVPMRVALAWILATSPDDGARDGAKALHLMEPLVSQSPNDPALLDGLAAALAESGRYDEAGSVAVRAVALYQRIGDTRGETRARLRLASYRANRPWRQ